jgi:hypothetical protein
MKEGKEIKSEHGAIEAVKEDGWYIEDVPQELFTQQSINERIKHVKIERQNQAIKDKAKSFADMNSLKDGGINDDALIRESKKIPSQFLTAEITQICFDVIRRHGSWIQYIPEERITQEMCEDAVNSNLSALEHVPNQYKIQAMRERWADDQLKDAASLRKLKLAPRECMTQKIEDRCIEIISEKPRQYFTNIHISINEASYQTNEPSLNFNEPSYPESEASYRRSEPSY